MPRQYIRDPKNPLNWIPVGGGSSMQSTHQAIAIQQNDDSYILQTSFASLSKAYKNGQPVILLAGSSSDCLQRYDLASHTQTAEDEKFIFTQLFVTSEAVIGQSIEVRNENSEITVYSVSKKLTNDSSGTNSVPIMVLDKAEYDAITSKSPDTLYFIKG